MTALNSFSSFSKSSAMSSVVSPSKLSSGEESEGGGGGGGMEVEAAEDSGSLELLSVETEFLSFSFLSFSTAFGVVIGEVFRL